MYFFFFEVCILHGQRTLLTTMSHFFGGASLQLYGSLSKLFTRFVFVLCLLLCIFIFIFFRVGVSVFTSGFVCTRLQFFKMPHWSVVVRKGWATVSMLSWLRAGLFNWKSMARKTGRQIQWELKYKWNTTISVSLSCNLFSYFWSL